MTFPLPPIAPPVQGATPDTTSGRLPVADQVPFGLMFDLGKTEDALVEVDVQTSPENPEIIEEQDDGKAEQEETDKQRATADVEATPVQPPLPEKPQKTLLESTFATIVFQPRARGEKPPSDQVSQSTNHTVQLRAETPKSGAELKQTEKTLPVLPQVVERRAGPQSQTLAPTEPSLKSAAPIQQDMSNIPIRPEANVAMRQTRPFNDGVPRDSRAQPSEGKIEAQPARLPQATTPVQAAPIGQYALATVATENRSDARTRKADAPPLPTQPQVNSGAAVPVATSAPVTPAIAPVLATTTQDAELSKHLAEAPLGQGISDLQTGPSRTSAPEATQMPAPTPQLAKTVSHQMAVAVSQAAGGSTEIVLSPEELGKVRMVMSAQETGITVLIHAERPETNDLLRRHIETLSQEFKNLGYSTASFTFAQDQQPQSEQHAESHDLGKVAPDDTQDVMHPVGKGSSSGLDLRI